MNTQDIRDRLLRVTRELLECVTELEAVETPSRVTGQSILHAVTAGMNEADTIVHETRRPWRCRICGGGGLKTNPGEGISCDSCGVSA